MSRNPPQVNQTAVTAQMVTGKVTAPMRQKAAQTDSGQGAIRFQIDPTRKTENQSIFQENNPIAIQRSPGEKFESSPITVPQFQRRAGRPSAREAGASISGIE